MFQVVIAYGLGGEHGEEITFLISYYYSLQCTLSTLASRVATR